MLEKLKSRKLWAAVVGVIVGIAMIFGLDEGAISTVSGAIVTIASTLGYMIAESKVDAASVQSVIDSAETIVDEVKKIINE